MSNSIPLNKYLNNSPETSTRLERFGTTQQYNEAKFRGWKNRKKILHKKLLPENGIPYTVKGAKTKKVNKNDFEKMSPGEKIIADILIKNEIQFNFDKPYRKLVNPKTKQPLRFDFYIHSFRAVIEYDGKQHFDPRHEYHKTTAYFKNYQQRDKFKNEFCKRKGIRMFRIKYTDYHKTAIITQKIVDKLTESRVKIGLAAAEINKNTDAAWKRWEQE